MLIKNKFFFFILFFVIILNQSLLFSEEKAKAAKPVSGSARNEAAGKEAAFSYSSGQKRDPFIPLVSSDGRILEPPLDKKISGEPHLEGIMFDSTGVSYAIIDAEVVKAGDIFGEYQILEIQPQKVKFSQQGREFEVELKVLSQDE